MNASLNGTAYVKHGSGYRRASERDKKTPGKEFFRKVDCFGLGLCTRTHVPVGKTDLLTATGRQVTTFRQAERNGGYTAALDPVNGHHLVRVTPAQFRNNVYRYNVRVSATH